MRTKAGMIEPFLTFAKSHAARGVFILLIFLALFEFSTMILSPRGDAWIPSFQSVPSFAFLSPADPRVVRCNDSGCWDQFGSLYDRLHLDFAQKPNGTILIDSSNSSHNASLLKNITGMDLCSENPTRLVGPVKVMTDRLSEEEILKSNSELEPGGRFRPKNCISRNKVAVILPYRDREEHLRIFLNNMHPILQRQELDYGIFVIEQKAGGKFNRGMLMNVGYAEAKKAYDYQCFVFHDVDLLPEDDRNLYSCPSQPRHMSVAIDKFSYRLPYNTILGGASAFTDEQFTKINGFPNVYWGWGGEDDDISARVRLHGYNISRYPPSIARYKMIRHGLDASNPVNPIRFDLLRTASKRFKNDGLSNLKYTVLDSQLRPLFTWIHVDISAPAA